WATGGAASGGGGGGTGVVVESPDAVYCIHCRVKQPKDYNSGDLCVSCGKQAEPILSCYWCSSSGPGKFCRQCGAEFVATSEFDPDQIENFSRIYQRHAIAVARHVDEVRFLERFLRQKVWSAALEDELIPQLPWNEEMLARMSAATTPPGDELARVKAIQETT